MGLKPRPNSGSAIFVRNWLVLPARGKMRLVFLPLVCLFVCFNGRVKAAHLELTVREHRGTRGEHCF